MLVTGRPASINWIDRHVPAIIQAWFPGEFGGRAVADVLFGDYNPGGRLPVTFPRSVGQLPFNFPCRPASQAGQGKGTFGKTRVNTALYPLGFGLSYTTFEYGDLEVSPSRVAPDCRVKVRFTVTNTGDRTGDDVPQLYLADEYSSVITYERMLRGFARVSLEPGEKCHVEFAINPEDLQLIDRTGRIIVEPGWFTVAIGRSTAEMVLEKRFEVVEP